MCKSEYHPGCVYRPFLGLTIRGYFSQNLVQSGNNETEKMQPQCLDSLTCQRISTDVVVCGVTERIAGASSGADKKEKAR